MENILFWGTIFLLGAAHALEPGHGKLLVTSYLAGSQAHLKDAFLLGLVVAVFHTLSVALLGALVVFVAFTFFQEAFLNSIQILSGVVILMLGILLFWRRFLRKDSLEDHCDCHLLHATPVTQEASVRPQASLKEVVLLGIASGMTPCPMALAALIAALTMGKVLTALGALAVFSLGIGSVLIILGVVLIQGTDNLLAKWQRFRQAPLYIARASAIIVLLLGCYLVTKPLLFPDDSHQNEDKIKQLMTRSFLQVAND